MSDGVPDGLRLVVSDSLGDDDIYAVAMLIERAAEADGVRPLSEHVVLHLLHANDVDQTHICAWAGTSLAGYGHLDWATGSAVPNAEMAIATSVAPGVGLANAVLDRLFIEAKGRLNLWAHGSHTSARQAADARGLEIKRELLRMSRPLSGALPKAPLPAGVTVRSFDPDRDSTAWLELNARAFTALPDQGGWGPEDLALRLAAPWFQPAGFLLAHQRLANGEEGPLVGFHWTKVHGDAGHSDAGHGHAAAGEVYVLAVDPDAASRGLGRALTILGLQHLKAQGLTEVMLYVDADNAAARRTYEKLGFRVVDTDFLFAATDAAAGTAHAE